MLKLFSFILICLQIVNPIFGDRFAISLIKRYNLLRKGNFVISPLTVSHALTHLYLANEDKIDIELRKFLRFKSSDIKNNIKHCRDYYARALTAEFRIATQLYVPLNLTATDKFEQISKEIHANVQNIDYSTPGKAALTMNMWLSDAMHKNFGNLMSDNDLTSETDLVSLSGISFLPNWKNKFYSRWKKPFTVRPAEGKPYVIYVNTMYTSARFATFHDKNARGIFLPLERSSVGILIILPIRQGTPTKIFQNVDSYFNIKLKPAKRLSLFLPMFKIIVGTELTPLLKRSGVKQIFEGYKYVEALGTDKPLSVDKFKTKAVIEIRADKDLIEIEDPADEDDAIFEVNRPFVFLIKDKSRIFAAGRVDSLIDLNI